MVSRNFHKVGALNLGPNRVRGVAITVGLSAVRPLSFHGDSVWLEDSTTLKWRDCTICLEGFVAGMRTLNIWTTVRRFMVVWEWERRTAV